MKKNRLRKWLFLLTTVVVSFTGCKTNLEKDIPISNEQDIDLDNHDIEESEMDRILSDNRTHSVKKQDQVKTYRKNTYGYVTKQVYLRKDTNNTKTKSKLNLYQKVKLLKREDNWILVKYDKNKGYIKKDNVKRIKSEFIDVDISDQKLTYYDKNGDVDIKVSVVTGLPTKERQTVLGYYSIYGKQLNRNLNGREASGRRYSSHVDYWMPFFRGYGLHDASWRSKFGEKIYQTNGSHGCVNLPPKVAKKVYEKSKIGTPVLIHK